MLLPPYIYRMIDHIYISDTRAFVFKDHFDIIILTDGVTHSGPLLTRKLSKTICIAPTPGKTDKTEDIVTELKHDTTIAKRILLYASDIHSVCRIFVIYLKAQYQFSKEDISRIVSNGLIPMSIVNIFLYELDKT